MTRVFAVFIVIATASYIDALDAGEYQMWTVPASVSCAEAFIDRMREVGCLKEVVDKMIEEKIICEAEGIRNIGKPLQK